MGKSQGGAQLNIDREILSQTENVFILEFAEDQRVVKLQHPEDVNPDSLRLSMMSTDYLRLQRAGMKVSKPAELTAGCEVVVRESEAWHDDFLGALLGLIIIAATVQLRFITL